MEVIVTVFLCVLGLFLYLLNENNNENLELKRKLREKENEIRTFPNEETPKIREVVVEKIVEKPIYIQQPKKPNYFPEQIQKSNPQYFSNDKRFVQVIFKKNSKRRYDYFLGENYDVQVGDFVVVWVHDKFSGENKWKIAKVLYISSPYEVSEKATSTVIKKADRPKW